MTNSSAPMLPNGDMEIVFSFDTTGSMSHCLERVRASLKEIMERLFADIPALKVALFAHGDYCDERSSYVTKYIDFTNNVSQLCKFASGVGATSGGDADECYELVLRQVHTELSWTPGSQRALVLIGDANPHEASYAMNKLKINWKKETQILKDMGVTIYGVNCGGPDCDKFYSHISNETGGRKIPLSDISSITQMVMAVCYREKGCEYFEAFEKEVRANRSKITKTLSGVFDALREGEDGMDDAEVPSPVAGSSGVKRKTPLKAKRVTKAMPKTAKKVKASKPKVSKAKRQLVLDADEEAPTPKRRRGSLSSNSSSSSGRSSRTVRVMTRSCRHPMSLRKVPAVLYGRIETKASKTSRRSSKPLRPVKVNRESVLGKQFLEELKWTPWYKVIAKDSLTSADWSPRPGSPEGVCRYTSFNDTTLPAIYEFAVATPGSSSRYPVYASVTKGYQNQTMEGKFLSRPHLKKQIDCVLGRNCRIYVRRAAVQNGEDRDDFADHDVESAVAELRHVIATKYDYAWQEHYNTETRTYNHRRLYKSGVLISE